MNWNSEEEGAIISPDSRKARKGNSERPARNPACCNLHGQEGRVLREGLHLLGGESRCVEGLVKFTILKG